MLDEYTDKLYDQFVGEGGKQARLLLREEREKIKVEAEAMLPMLQCIKVEAEAMLPMLQCIKVEAEAVTISTVIITIKVEAEAAVVARTQARRERAQARRQGGLEMVNIVVNR